MKRALITASVFGFLGSFEKSDIRLLQEQGYEVTVGANASSELGAFGDHGQLDNLDVKKRQIDFSRSPHSISNIRAYRQLKTLIREGDFDLIHCHTPVGGILTRLAARKTRKQGTKVLYTAHGFHFYKGAPLKNWLLFYPVEKLCAHFTDVLITINQEDYALAKQKMRAGKVEYIPGVGVDTAVWQKKETDRDSKRRELGIPEDGILLLSVGELNSNKNHAAVIRALAECRDPRMYYAVVGQGELRESLRDLVRSLSVEKQVLFPGYQNDVPAWMNAADIFCHPSHREGLPVSLVEAIAIGLPVVCSRIRGNTDLVIEEKGGFLCSPSSPEEFAQAIQTLADDPALRQSMGTFNAEHAKDFDISQVRNRMRKIHISIQDKEKLGI